jgi:site-specific recombinase XerD
MKTERSETLGAALRDFFDKYVAQMRGMSRHTALSYRDSLKLLLIFVARQKHMVVADLSIQSLGVDEITAFLGHLESERRNGIGTRNVRLSAIHSFFRHVATVYPEHLHQSQRILSIPFKRSPTRTIDYLEFEEIKAVLDAVDRSAPDGRRDYALLALMFNTGARVQEIVNLKGTDLELSKPSSVRLYGKGRKERICPIWPETSLVLREYLEERGVDVRQPRTVFTNHLGGPLSRFGVRYILAKHVRKASLVRPSLGRKRLHPHSMRHSTAVHLLKSGIDPSSIAHWLGHASVNTTNKYAVMDIEMKRNALSKAKPLDTEKGPKGSWRKRPDILAWLESL